MPLSKLSILALSLLAASQATYAFDQVAATGCGTEDAPHKRASAEAHFRARNFHPTGALNHRNCNSSTNGTGPGATINVRFNVIYENETEAGGYIPDKQIQDAMVVMNQHYANTSLSFNLAETNRVQNESWFQYVREKTSDYKTEMWNALHKGDEKTLNVYTLSFMYVPGLRGFASFPSDYQTNPVGDGVQVQYQTFPGGAYPNFNDGISLVHETGHWLGLYHTWQTGCEAPDDYVEDTPREDLNSRAADQCPIGVDTCPSQNGTDPITNIMSYSSCRSVFTNGQFQRVKEQIATYRGINLP